MTTMSKRASTFHGWRVYAHPCFLAQLEDLISTVEALKQRSPATFHEKKPAKRLAAILRLITEDIPRDPASPAYRLGNALGDGHRHWFRAKFFQQYRLFFRFRNDAKVIVICWVNDDATKRAYGSKTDAYAVFQRMVESGNPPDDWEELVSNASELGDDDLPFSS